MKKFLLSFFALVLVITGCGDSSTEPDPNAHVGTYTVVSINGSNLPAVLGVEDGMTISFVSGSMTFTANNTVAGAIKVRGTLGTTVIEEEESLAGTYARNGNSILVTWSDDGSTQPMTFDENKEELTFTSEGNVFLLRKQ